MQDPLGLDEAPAANVIRSELASPPQHLSRLYERITNPACADAVEVRVLLLAHLTYLTYADLKETFAQ